MEPNNEAINYIPNGAILLKNKIYIPYINKDGEIPFNSIIYNNNIYIEFKALAPHQTKKKFRQ